MISSETTTQNAMEQETAHYVVIWSGASERRNCANYGFAMKEDLANDDCTYAEIDLTAEEVGQLLGGS